MYSITLFVIDIHDIRCLEPFLPPYDHFEILRFFGLGLSYGIPEGKGLSEPQFKFKDGFAYFICLISPRFKIQMYHTFEIQIHLHFKSVIYINIY